MFNLQITGRKGGECIMFFLMYMSLELRTEMVLLSHAHLILGKKKAKVTL